MAKYGTYVFCVVAGTKSPRLRDVPRGLPGMRAVRAIDMGRGLHAVVADVPLDRYDESAINRGLSDLDWVARTAIAHEAIVERFINEPAVLPMKLFTIFTNDQRALEHLGSERERIAAVVKRVTKHQEWGVRVRLDRAKASARSRDRSAGRRTAKGTHGSGGAAYLTRKKTQRAASVELASRAQSTVAALYNELAANARLARRRAGPEPEGQGSVVLDAAFLVPRTRAASFRALTARRARALSSRGYAVTVTGPWPPYTFVQD